MQFRALACSALAIAATGSMPASGASAAVEALARPAVMVRAPGSVVLLGAATAGSRIVAVGERGIVALSDDGGQHWRQAAVPTSVTLTAVRFADARHGWAVGHGAVVLATEDGGEHWAVQLDGRRAAQIVLAAAKSAGDAKAVQDAQRFVDDGPDKPLLDLLVLGDRRLLAVGAYGLALASEDAGRTWASWMPRLPNPKGLHLYAARQRGPVVLLAGEQGLVLASTDGGQAFRRLETPYKGSFFSAELPGDHDIVVAGLKGHVVRSTDDGANWNPIATPMPVSITATALAPDGRLLAVNQAGFVMVLQGDRLLALNRSPLPPLNGLLSRADAPTLALSVLGAMPLPPSKGTTP